tara:strand:+ start:291 stop:746 length:456 start_codon:yes stop_codon:yes gene_type:complete
MFKHTKIFRRHDINSFTGTFSNNFYHFTKNNGQTISCSRLEHYLDETDLVNFLGWQTEDILRAFPLKRYDSVTSAVIDLDFEWHESVSYLVIDTEYELLDSSSLKCTCSFKSESAWDEFNLVVDKHKLPHGFKQFGIGIFYEGAKINNSNT